MSIPYNDTTNKTGSIQECESILFGDDYGVISGNAKKLAELTRILPEDTYLDRLSMHQETTQMQGKSGNAQSLIELVNDSDHFENASFRGPTRLDNRSGKEIFDLNADNTTMGATDNTTKDAD